MTTPLSDPKAKNITIQASELIPVVLDNVHCSGQEAELADCWQQQFVEFCSHITDAGVDCTHVTSKSCN